MLKKITVGGMSLILIAATMPYNVFADNSLDHIGANGGNEEHSNWIINWDDIEVDTSTNLEAVEYIDGYGVDYTEGDIINSPAIGDKAKLAEMEKTKKDLQDKIKNTGSETTSYQVVNGSCFKVIKTVKNGVVTTKQEPSAGDKCIEKKETTLDKDKFIDEKGEKYDFNKVKPLTKEEYTEKIKNSNQGYVGELKENPFNQNITKLESVYNPKDKNKIIAIRDSSTGNLFKIGEEVFLDGKKIGKVDSKGNIVNDQEEEIPITATGNYYTYKKENNVTIGVVSDDGTIYRFGDKIPNGPKEKKINKYIIEENKIAATQSLDDVMKATQFYKLYLTKNKHYQLEKDVILDKNGKAIKIGASIQNEKGEDIAILLNNNLVLMLTSKTEFFTLDDINSLIVSSHTLFFTDYRHTEKPKYIETGIYVAGDGTIDYNKLHEALTRLTNHLKGKVVNGEGRAMFYFEKNVIIIKDNNTRFHVKDFEKMFEGYDSTIKSRPTLIGKK